MVTGSFDPVTKGHTDIIRTAAGMFGHVIVAVLCNTEKTYMFTLKQRTEMLTACCAEIPGCTEIRSWDGLLVDFLDAVGADIVLRGLRDARDLDFEQQIAQVNALLRPGTQTIWVSAAPANQAISSTIVRELVRFRANLEPFVPHAVLPLIRSYVTD